MTDTSTSLTRTIHSRTSKTSDIEIHVSTLETSAGTFVDIREYVVSLERYGRGLTFPLSIDSLSSVAKGIQASADLIDAVDGS